MACKSYILNNSPRPTPFNDFLISCYELWPIKYRISLWERMLTQNTSHTVQCAQIICTGCKVLDHTDSCKQYFSKMYVGQACKNIKNIKIILANCVYLSKWFAILFWSVCSALNLHQMGCLSLCPRCPNTKLSSSSGPCVIRMCWCPQAKTHAGGNDDGVNSVGQ